MDGTPWVILRIILIFLVKAKSLSMTQDSQSESGESFNFIENFDLEPPPHMIVRAPDFAPCSTNWLSRPVCPQLTTPTTATPPEVCSLNNSIP